MKRYTIVPGNESYAQWSSYLFDIQSNIFSLVDYVNLFQTPYEKHEFTTNLYELGFREYILNESTDNKFVYYRDLDPLKETDDIEPAGSSVPGKIGYYVSLVQPFPYDIPDARRQEGLITYPIEGEDAKFYQYGVGDYALYESMREKPADWETNYTSYYTRYHTDEATSCNSENGFGRRSSLLEPASLAIYKPYFPNMYYNKVGEGKFEVYTSAEAPENWYTDELQNNDQNKIRIPDVIAYKHNTNSTWSPYTYYKEITTIFPHEIYRSTIQEGHTYWYQKKDVLPPCYLFIPFSEGSCYALSVSKQADKTVFNFEIGSDPLRNVAVNTIAQSDCRFDFIASYSPITQTFSIPTSNGVDFMIKDPRGMALMTKGQNSWIQLYDKNGEELFCDATLRTDIENLSSGDFLVYNIISKSMVAPYFPKTVRIEVF